MYYQGQMMNPSGSSCRCNDSCPTAMPTSTQCNQVVQTCNVQEVPHYTNYHTHVVNNCIKKHINIPVYSQSSENVLIDEYVQGLTGCAVMFAAAVNEQHRGRGLFKPSCFGPGHIGIHSIAGNKVVSGSVDRLPGVMSGRSLRLRRADKRTAKFVVGFRRIVDVIVSHSQKRLE